MRVITMDRDVTIDLLWFHTGRVFVTRSIRKLSRKVLDMLLVALMCVCVRVCVCRYWWLTHQSRWYKRYIRLRAINWFLLCFYPWAINVYDASLSHTHCASLYRYVAVAFPVYQPKKITCDFMRKLCLIHLLWSKLHGWFCV